MIPSTVVGKAVSMAIVWLGLEFERLQGAHLLEMRIGVE